MCCENAAAGRTALNWPLARRAGLRWASRVSARGLPKRQSLDLTGTVPVSCAPHLIQNLREAQVSLETQRLHFPAPVAWNWQMGVAAAGSPLCVHLRFTRLRFPRAGGLQTCGSSVSPAIPATLTPGSSPWTGFDLMDSFSVKTILGKRESGAHSSYVRMGSFPVVQRTE